MSTELTEHTLFRPTRSKSETKADITDQTARAIIEADAERRESKTARLRQARLESEANSTDAPAPVKRRARKTDVTRRGRSSM